MQESFSMLLSATVVNIFLVLELENVIPYCAIRCSCRHSANKRARQLFVTLGPSMTSAWCINIYDVNGKKRRVGSVICIMMRS